MYEGGISEFVMISCHGRLNLTWQEFPSREILEKKWLTFFSLELENCIFISLFLLDVQDWKKSLSPLDLWDLKKNSLSLLDFQEFSGKFSFHSQFTRFCPLFLCRHIYKAILYSFICSTFLHCVFPSTSLNELLERIHNRTGCICLTFLHNALTNEPSNCLPGRIHIHTSYICLTCLHHGFSNVSSNCLPGKKQSHIGYICLIFLHCVISNVSSNCFPEKMQSHIDCICLTFLHCGF